MLIEINWIYKTDVTITEREMKFNVLENEILEQLENLKKVFETILERELLPRYEEMNYEITLKTEKIKPLSLIFTRSKKQKIIREYLNEMIKKK